MSEQEPINLGRYQPLRVIGHGGMGQVFEAWDPQLERRVALKVLRAADAVDASGDDPAVREARCLARVAHPQVVGVHEVGRCDGLVFIAMELVDGPDLGRWLCERPRRWTDVLERLLDAAGGLSQVHRAGLVHGDVKPGNVLIGRDGRVRIADFGLARVRSRAAAPELSALVRQAAAVVEAELTGEAPSEWRPHVVHERTGGSMSPRVGGSMSPPVGGTMSPRVGGTMSYMAPECLCGAEGDRRSDQYSFCVMAWEALFGVRPYPGQSAEAILGSIAAARIDRGRGRPRGMPSGIETVLRRGLSEDPARRWPDIETLISELERRRWRGRAIVRGFGIGALVATTMIAGLVAAQERPRGDEAELCAVERERLDGAWGPTERLELEQRAMRSSIVLPRREVRFISVHLDAWVEEWSRLWMHVCAGDAPDPAVRDCLIDERERFEAVLALLLDERREFSDTVGRALMAELELPTACLDRARRPASAIELGHLAELSQLEHRIEVALAVDDLEVAAHALAELDARVNRMSEVGEQPAPVARIRVAYWEARLLHAEGRHDEAKRALRWALADAERLGLERLRWDLLLARARVSADMGESVLDDVAALDSLAERLGQGDEALAELALVEASASEDPLASIVRLDRASDRLERVGPSVVPLLFELRAARHELHMRLADYDAAFVDARAAVALARAAGVGDGERLARAHLLLAEASARAGRCEWVSTALAGLTTTLSDESQRRGARARQIGRLGRVLDVLHSAATATTAECVDAHTQAWTLIAKLSTDRAGVP
jgi:predicted Ser/Thr protein kinase